MNKDTLLEVFSVILLIFIGVAAFILTIEPLTYYRHINLGLLQAIIVTLMFATVILAKRQIDEIKRIEKDKKIIAIQSLIEELKYNRDVIAQYIQHTEDGANLGKDGVYSWELNVPQFSACEKYLFVACRGNLETSKKIMNVYAQLEACKTIVYFIHQLLVNNIFTVKTMIAMGGQTNGDQLLWNEVAKHNKQLNDISITIKDSFNELIEKLEFSTIEKVGRKV